MKLKQDTQAYIWSLLGERKPVLIKAGEYKIIKREITEIGEEKVWLEHTADNIVFTSAPLITKTYYGKTPFGVAIDTSMVFVCSLCRREHPAVIPPISDVSDEQRKELREVYHKVSEEFLTSKSDPDDRLFRRAENAGRKYFSTLQNTVPLVPDTLVSHKNNLRCAVVDNLHPPIPKKVEKEK